MSVYSTFFPCLFSRVDLFPANVMASVGANCQPHTCNLTHHNHYSKLIIICTGASVAVMFSIFGYNALPIETVSELLPELRTAVQALGTLLGKNSSWQVLPNLSPPIGYKLLLHQHYVRCWLLCPSFCCGLLDNLILFCAISSLPWTNCKEWAVWVMCKLVTKC